MSRDPRIDQYIARSADFARPILAHIRAVVHAACPEIEETLKWGMPSFVHAGGIVCHMAAFKEHCAFGFWKRALVLGDRPADREAMGQFGRLTSVKDLPGDATLKRYVKKAARLNEEGVKAPPRARKAAPRPLVVPADLKAALARNAKARAAFEGFSPSHRREYVDWITEAKTYATREKRLATTLEWLVEGKTRMWKYARK